MRLGEAVHPAASVERGVRSRASASEGRARVPEGEPRAGAPRSREPPRRLGAAAGRPREDELHGVHRALSTLALLVRPSLPLTDLDEVERAAERTFGLRPPCDAVALQEVVGLAQQGGFTAKILRHFAEQGRHMHKWQRQRVSMTPRGIESCVCAEEGDPEEVRRRAVCASASADASERRFEPPVVRERPRC